MYMLSYRYILNININIKDTREREEGREESVGI